MTSNSHSKQKEESWPVRNKRRLFALLLLLFGLMAAGCRNAVIQGSSNSYQGRVQVTVGIHSSVLFGSRIPVLITVTGSYLDCGGSLRLTVPTNEEDYYAYELAIDEPVTETVSGTLPLDYFKVSESEEGSASYLFLVQAAMGNDRLAVELTDSEDRVIYSQICRYSEISSAESFGIGLVAEEEADYEFLETAFYVDGENVQGHVFSITLEEYPVVQGYEILSLILVEEALAEKLTAASAQLLEDWVQAGGCLIMEENKQLAGRILGEAKQLEAQMDCGRALLTGYQLGKGFIWVSDGSLTQLEGAYGEDQAYSTLRELMGTKKAAQLTSWINRSGWKEISLLKQTQGTVDTDEEKPAFALYAVIIGGYVLVLLPGTYLFLYKKGRLQWFRRVAASAALAVALAIFLFGSKTRFSEPFLHLLSYLECREDGEAEEVVYVSVQAPFNREYQVSFDAEYRLSALLDWGFWGSSGSSWTQADANIRIRKSNALDREELASWEVELGGLVAFDTRYWKLSRRVPQQGVTGSLSWKEEGGMEGSLINTTGSQLEQVLLVSGEQVWVLGTLAKEQTLDMTEEWDSLSKTGIALEDFINGVFWDSSEWDSLVLFAYQNYLQRRWNGQAQKEEAEDAGWYLIGVSSQLPEIQANTDYEVSGLSVVILPVTEEEGT